MQQGFFIPAYPQDALDESFLIHEYPLLFFFLGMLLKRLNKPFFIKISVFFIESLQRSSSSSQATFLLWVLLHLMQFLLRARLLAEPSVQSSNFSLLFSRSKRQFLKSSLIRLLVLGSAAVSLRSGLITRIRCMRFSRPTSNESIFVFLLVSLDWWSFRASIKVTSSSSSFSLCCVDSWLQLSPPSQQVSSNSCQTKEKYCSKFTPEFLEVGMLSRRISRILQLYFMMFILLYALQSMQKL